MKAAIIAFTVAAAALGTVAFAQGATPPAIVPQGDADGAFAVNGLFREPDGEKLYRRVCAACHMGDAKGATGAGTYPALAGNPKLATAAYPALVIVKGLNGMPPMGSMMTDQQVADTANYVRTHFGNDYKDMMKAEAVKALR